MNISDNPSFAGKCGECENRRASSFCNLPDIPAAELKALKIARRYARGNSLFVEGQKAKGVYILCTGHVKLLTYSERGKSIIVRIAEPGEVLGLSEVVSGIPYEDTAQASDDCYVCFISAEDFLEFIQCHPEAALNALRQLSRNNHTAHVQIRSLGLSASVGEKLVRLLLQWCDGRHVKGRPVLIARVHTHFEMAEMIGTTRETVTRLLNDFRDRGLITLSRTELGIPDRNRLKAAMGSKHGNGNGNGETFPAE